MENKSDTLNGPGLPGNKIPSKNMKKIIYALVLLLLIVSGLVFANRGSKNETSKKSTPKSHAVAEGQTELQKWEATPEGIKYKQWEASPEGKKVLASTAAIREHIIAFTNMEAVVTSLTLPPGSRLGLGVMVSINGEDYILSFGADHHNDIQQLRSLKVNDKIIIKSHTVSHAPKYSYPIISGDYVERDHKILYKRTPPKDGC